MYKHIPIPPLREMSYFKKRERNTTITMKTTALDRSHLAALHPFTDPAAIPVTYRIGEKTYHGFPQEFHPVAETRRVDANIRETVILAHTPEGLELKAVCQTYLDFSVVDWVMYVTNRGEANSPVLSDWGIVTTYTAAAPVLYHSNGDTCGEDGYTWEDTPLADGCDLSIRPCGDGTSCKGAFPYMRLRLDGWGINIAVGWTGTWKADFSRTGDTVTLRVGQASFASYLKPGETVRTPRMTYQAFDGGEDRARNLWRSFYLAHILPRENGQPLPPKLVLHTWMIDGLPEFCGVTEENQFRAIDTYRDGGLHPDIWWVDAGWYPCENYWPTTGNWYPHPEHFPNGMAPLGEKCDREGIQLLVWFEPERVFRDTWLYREHPEFLLRYRGEPNPWLEDNNLFNLGDPAACDWLIDYVSRFIQENHVRIYRQDFNFAPAPYWDTNTEEGRVGIPENLHIQGYYRYWDGLLERNPGLWIDSCASGGRRNDLETMRRAVPLHYTDVGYGKHPIKQLQHRQMFEWIPYFRAHTYNWDAPDGSYDGQNHPLDEFAFHNAFAPAMTCMVEWNDSPALYALARRMIPIWRRAAELELSGDYYPLTACRQNQEDFYAMQFDTEREGFIQIIRNNRVAEDSLTVFLHVDPTRTYTFADPLGQRSFTISGKRLAEEGFTDRLSIRSGVIWFYEAR